jgi:competence protein ComEC
VLIDGLFWALALILAVSPLSVFDLGLTLSMLAVAGIALLWPHWYRLTARLLPDPEARRFSTRSWPCHSRSWA